MAELDGKVALVTGASRGIGAAIARRLHEAGAHVVAAARSHERLAKMQAEFGDRLTTEAMDVSDEESVVACFKRIYEELGRLDILINNAGLGIYGDVVEFEMSDFDAVMDTNLRGCFCCCREAMFIMQNQKSGYIINISSVVGFKGYARQAAYTASKHGIMGLTKSLALEGQEHGVRVSAVLPGGVDTDMVAQARPDLDRSILIKPEDIAHTVHFLATLPGSCCIDQIYVRRAGAAPF